MVERDLRAMIGDAVAFSVMVGIGEAYVPAFVLAAGHGELAAGLVATLPMLAGAVFQLVTPFAVRRLGSYRRWVVLCARLQALSFVPLVAGAGLGRIPVWLVFAAIAAYWGAGMATSPAWNAWVTALVPAEQRAGFFARRTRYGQAALFLALVAGGVTLEGAASGARPLAAFGVLFALALAARWVSAGYLTRHGEPAGLAAGHLALSPPEVLARLRRGSGSRLLIYLLAMQVAVQVSAPFFAPYMLKQLALSYWSFTALIGVSFLARIAALPALGRLAHRRGAGAVLRLGAVGIVPLPAFWLISDELAFLLLLQTVAGLAWAALEFGTLLSFFEGLHERERASILTVFNFANTVAMGAGSLVGAWLLSLAGEPRDAYAAVFLASVAARALTLALLPRVRRGVAAPEQVALRTLAVRPSAGAIQRPILSTLSAESEEPGAP